MKLHSFCINNFRRLKHTHTNLEEDISIFVGSNNSGKTSATQALEVFIKASKDKLAIHDFNIASQPIFNEIGKSGFSEKTPRFPTMSVDLWFDVLESDLYHVLDLLPSLEWKGTQVGIRISFQAKNAEYILEQYNEVASRIQEAIPHAADAGSYKPWPSNMVSYLERELSHHYEFAYSTLDRTHFNEKFETIADKFEQMPLLPERGKAVINSLVRVDLMNAQRHLGDINASARAENLSKCLSRFYQRNLEKRADDLSALKALSDSEEQLNNHLEKVFEPTLKKLSVLGYPGFGNPTLLIKSALNPALIMNQDTKLHYSINDEDKSITLPDSYNGLGFKNLIYMVIEILDLQARWVEEEEDRALVHLIFIEEPEAHLHAQLQQVFIRKILELLQIEGDDNETFKSQIVVTTHSPHILYERGFKPIRYFRRNGSSGIEQFSDCLNLSQFYEEEVKDRDFLQKYLKLTHCDLFFADAAILVEGNVERILLPTMISKVATALQISYLSILEVGGAFAYRFKTLIEFLGITALVITDIDSVTSKEISASSADEIDADDDETSRGTACLVSTSDAVTSNQTLISWLPKKNKIADLLNADIKARTQEPSSTSNAKVHVVYQNLQTVEWNGQNKKFAGRTLEEAFALENANWCQHNDRKDLGLMMKVKSGNIEDYVEKIHNRVKSSSFNKTSFALNVLTLDEQKWEVPSYIKEGLQWLVEQLDKEPKHVAKLDKETDDKTKKEATAS